MTAGLSDGSEQEVVGRNPGVVKKPCLVVSAAWFTTPADPPHPHAHAHARTHTVGAITNVRN